MIGSTLSHYQIEEELGRGGMGIVYRAEDTNLDRTVAIKVLPEGALASEDDRARFFREAKAAAALNHPNIAVIYEVGAGSPDGSGTERPFIAMEFIEGHTLDERIKKSPLPLEEAVRLTRQVADGLQAAHAKDIVHRDVKAANIMLDGQGRAKILDFGLALTAQSTKLTRMGSTLGTVACMSPEQARGEEVDQRTDIWAIGVLLYEMVSGRNPFNADYEQAVVYNILNEDPEPLTSLRTGVPMGLEFIVNKCLTKDKKARYASAGDLIVDLDSLDGLTKRLSTMSSGPRSAILPASESKSEFNPWLVTAVACVLVGFLGWWIGSSGEKPSTEVRTFPIQLDNVTIVSDLTVGPDDRNALVQVGTGVGSNAMLHWSLETGKRQLLSLSGFFLFPAITGEGALATYTSWGVGTQLLDLQTGSPSSVLSGFWGGMFMPDGTLIGLPTNTSGSTNDGIVVATRNGSIERVAVRTDTTRGHSGLYPIRPVGSGPHLLGYAVRTDTEADLVWMDIEKDTYNVIVALSTYRGLDSDGFLYWEVDGDSEALTLSAQRLDSDSGQLEGEPVVLTLPNDYPDSKSFVSEKGSLFIYGNQELPYVLRWLDSNEVVPTEANVSVWPQVSNDGGRIASMGNGGMVVNVTDLATGTILRIYQGNYVTHASWSADDRFLLLSGDRNISSRILRVAADGSGQTDTLHVSTRFAREAVLSPDGSQMAYLTAAEYDNDAPWEIWVKDLDTGQEQVVASKPDRFLHNPVWSPDGRFIAYEETYDKGPFGTGQAIRVREVGTDRDWLVSQGTETDRFWDPVWSPDGDYIYFREPTVLHRRGVRYEPSFGPVGPVETVSNFVDEFNYTIDPSTGRVLARAPDMTFETDAPDVVMIQNWANAWKAERGIK